MGFKQRIRLDPGRLVIAMGLFGAAVAIGRFHVSPFDWQYRPLMLAGSAVVVAASFGVLVRRTPWLLAGAMIGVAPVLWCFKDLISSALPF